MKKLFILLICLLAAKNLFAWGQKGHDVTAYVAECHLTPEAAEKIDKILGGHSLVYYANWMDIASHTPEYAYTKTWHYLNVDEGQTIDSMPKNE
ncbi:MAG: S1/P1 nuclease, partial [Alistipes sp.]